VPTFALTGLLVWLQQQEGQQQLKKVRQSRADWIG
jgi:hypothetical protein